MCAWVESGSRPFICTIETLKCIFEKTCLWLQGSHLDGVSAEFWFPSPCCTINSYTHVLLLWGNSTGFEQDTYS